MKSLSIKKNSFVQFHQKIGFKFINYDPNSNFNDGTCVLGVAGCTDDDYV